MELEIKTKLISEFESARLRNPSYSLRAFSNSLGIPVSALSDILNGKRSITQKMAIRILDGLGVSQIETKCIIDKKPLDQRTDISLEYFKVISDWYYFAIMSLSETEDFSSSPEWIAKRLNISEKQASTALSRLIKLELLEEKDGEIHPTGIQVKTPTDIANLSLKNHTIQSLELAKESLLKDPIDKRDFSTITMAIAPENLDEAKIMISKFRKKLSKKLESGKKTEVYKLAIQLFPLTSK